MASANDCCSLKYDRGNSLNNTNGFDSSTAQSTDKTLNGLHVSVNAFIIRSIRSVYNTWVDSARVHRRSIVISLRVVKNLQQMTDTHDISLGAINHQKSINHQTGS